MGIRQDPEAAGKAKHRHLQQNTPVIISTLTCSKRHVLVSKRNNPANLQARVINSRTATSRKPDTRSRHLRRATGPGLLPMTRRLGAPGHPAAGQHATPADAGRTEASHAKSLRYRRAVGSPPESGVACPRGWRVEVWSEDLPGSKVRSDYMLLQGIIL